MTAPDHTGRRPYTFDRVVRLIISLVLLAAAVWLINVLKDVLLPFCIACLVAYILEPFVQFNRELLRLKGRAVAIFVTLFEVTLILGILAYLCVPSIINEMHQMGALIERYSSSDVAIPLLPDGLHDFIRRNINLDNLASSFDGQSIDSLLDKLGSVISGSLSILLHAIEWLSTFVYIIFVMLDYEQLMRGFRLLVPPKYRPAAYRIGNDIKVSMNRYFRGQALIAMCAAVMYCIGFSVIGIPMAIVLGIIVGILFMIPYFQYITIIPVTFVCIIYSMDGDVDFWSVWWGCILVYVISQCVCDYILTPKIMGKAMGLNPAIILLSLSVWGTLLGLMGMIIALPLTTLCLAYYDRYILHGGNNENTTDDAHSFNPFHS